MDSVKNNISEIRKLGCITFTLVTRYSPGDSTVSTDGNETVQYTDRYFIDRNKSHYRLICHSNKRDICTCIYKNVSLLKSKTIYMV